MLATPLLGQPVTKKIRAAGVTVPQTVLPFSADVPAQARYGVTVGSRPVYYASQAQLRKGLDLSC